jgi:hypothetical protein
VFDGIDVRLENLEGGYSVCFEAHTLDVDLAGLFGGLPDDRAHLPRWGYAVMKNLQPRPASVSQSCEGQ